VDEAADVPAETFLVAWHERARRRRGRLDARLREVAPGGTAPSGDRGVLAAAFEGLSAQDRELLSLAGWEGLGCTAPAAVSRRSSSAQVGR
jgi:DNA-directed RNA polymerase specialized sigma24 family protein